jgi:hypothetical protein
VTSPRAPLAVARAGIGLAVLALPRRADRERYAAEFLAELHHLSPPDQLRHTAGVLSRAVALRAALAGSPSSEEEPMSRVPFWRCRVFHWHDWARRSTSDGGRYEQCRRCGKDRGPISNLPTTTPPATGPR